MWLDDIIQMQRFRIAERFIPEHARLLDIGCGNGVFFHFLKKKRITGIGIDLLAPEISKDLLPGVSLIKDGFPKHNLAGEKFDCISALAVFEHIPEKDHTEFAGKCHSLLRERGRVILTVPSPFVDYIIHVLLFLRLIEGMSHEEHYGFDPSGIPPVFRDAGFGMVVHKKFEFGLNNVFVFEKLT